MLHLGQLQASFAEFSSLNTLNGMPLFSITLASCSFGDLSAPGGKAMAFFGEAVGVDGADADVLQRRLCQLVRRQPQGAIQWLREAVRRNPADDAAHYVLVWRCRRRGIWWKPLARRSWRGAHVRYAEWEAKGAGSDVMPRGLERVKLDIDMPASLRVEAALGVAGQRDQRAIATFHLDNGRRLFQDGRDEEAIAELRRTIFQQPAGK